MTGVVLRCPNCGTSRTSTGECEACHEAEVRYQCTNHTPGRWLDSPACTQCGARWGSTAVARPPVPTVGPSPSAAPRRPPYASPPPAARPRSPVLTGRADGARPGAARADRIPPAEGGMGRMPRDADEGSGSEMPGRIGRVTSWQDLLKAMAGARPTVRRYPGRGAAPEPEVVPRRGGLGGCLGRLVMFAVFLVFVVLGGLFAFGASLFQMLRL